MQTLIKQLLLSRSPSIELEPEVAELTRQPHAAAWADVAVPQTDVPKGERTPGQTPSPNHFVPHAALPSSAPSRSFELAGLPQYNDRQRSGSRAWYDLFLLAVFLYTPGIDVLMAVHTCCLSYLSHAVGASCVTYTTMNPLRVSVTPAAGTRHKSSRMQSKQNRSTQVSTLSLDTVTQSFEGDLTLHAVPRISPRRTVHW